jgi:hypothetical protein
VVVLTQWEMMAYCSPKISETQYLGGSWATVSCIDIFALPHYAMTKKLVSIFAG